MIKDLHETEGVPLEAYCPYAPGDTANVYNHIFFNLKNVNTISLKSNIFINILKLIII